MINELVKMTAIVVIYNKGIDQSLTLNKIGESHSGLDVLVVDNSETDYGNAAACYRRGFRYHSMNGNEGLSRAYNAAIDISSSSDVFILFDDDTDVPNDYFRVLKDALLKMPEIDIYAPVVIGQDGVVYSPNRSCFLRNELISSPKENVEESRFNAISSCLAIRANVFDDYRFNEMLFVDQVDQNFFDDMRDAGKRFAKLDIVVRQNFYQRGDDLSPERGWLRLKLRLIDLMRYARLKGCGCYVLLGYLKCCGLGIQIAMKTRSAAVVAKSIALATALLFFPR